MVYEKNFEDYVQDQIEEREQVIKTLGQIPEPQPATTLKIMFLKNEIETLSNAQTHYVNTKDGNRWPLRRALIRAALLQVQMYNTSGPPEMYAEEAEKRVTEFLQGKVSWCWDAENEQIEEAEIC